MFLYYRSPGSSGFQTNFEDIDLFNLIGSSVPGHLQSHYSGAQLPCGPLQKRSEEEANARGPEGANPDVKESAQLLDYTEDDLEETFCLNFTIRRKLWCHRGLGTSNRMAKTQ
ncbi:hypothetical protein FQN60_013992 [Etheostoma spectabile]|uniref:Uncharacterized protein n=1 Tax=Etheostoma spectabile TaxID=54343 RepID=A0A5J5D5Q3_9PERO|nr:hypothetical protein FQN60_013992 [Etheostoma spectabile]